ncbi:MAG: hypothetical protein EOM05_05640 [Clostridia bacterium]|nr:hypothetical protein [Clostridia bacterium]
MNSVEAMIKSFGRDVSLHMSDGWTSGSYRAFLQPLRYKNKMYLEGLQTDIGFSEQGYYLYIGPEKHNLSALPKDAWIADCDNKKYYINKVEKVFLGNKALYIWAIVKSVEEADYE